MGHVIVSNFDSLDNNMSIDVVYIPVSGLRIDTTREVHILGSTYISARAHDGGDAAIVLRWTVEPVSFTEG
jgi:hypothetical protein